MKVLVTRLEADAIRTANMLAGTGFDPVVFPLTEMLVIKAEPKTSHPDFSVFTSINGVRSVSSELALKFRNFPAYAVGPRTADELAKKAYKDIRIGVGTATDLANMIMAEQGETHARGVYFCGKERSFDFAAALKDRVDLELCEVYEIHDRLVTEAERSAIWDQVNGGAALVYSQAGAKRLLQFLDAASAHEAKGQFTIVAISEQAASPFQDTKIVKLAIASEPNEQAMTDALRRVPSTSV